MNNKKFSYEPPVLIAQNPDAPILWGGFQLTNIKCDENKDLFVKFYTRRDSFDTRGREIEDPIYKSSDAGKTWTKVEKNCWYKAEKPLPNGDKLTFGETPLVKNIGKLPETKDDRTLFCGLKTYTIDEINENKTANIEKKFKCYRVYAGSDEVTEEYCNINWDNMPVLYNEDGNYLVTQHPECEYRVDKNGTMWITLFGGAWDEDKKLINDKYNLHILRSDDNGHNFDYVSSIIYKDEYNHKDSLKIEGFNEVAMEFLEDGTMMIIVRTGSLSPIEISTDENPMPILYMFKSTDGGKTWSAPEKFHDYGIRPRSVKMPDGTVVLVSGRPGIYLKHSLDEKCEKWSEPDFFMTVPKEDIYTAYYEYSCYNSALCVYDEKTIFMSYSDFKRNTPDGKRAKSIMVVKINVE